MRLTSQYRERAEEIGTSPHRTSYGSSCGVPSRDGPEAPMLGRNASAGLQGFLVEGGGLDRRTESVDPNASRMIAITAWHVRDRPSRGWSLPWESSRAMACPRDHPINADLGENPLDDGPSIGAATTGPSRDQSGRMATARAGPALPPRIFSGKHDTWNPKEGSAPRLTSRSICEYGRSH
jgi:hypothetical protein